MDTVIKKRKFVFEIVNAISHKYLPELEKKIKERKEKEKQKGKEKEKQKEKERTILRQKNPSMGKKRTLTNINTINNNTTKHSNTNTSINSKKAESSSSQKKFSKNKVQKYIYKIIKNKTLKIIGIPRVNNDEKS